MKVKSNFSSEYFAENIAGGNERLNNRLMETETIEKNGVKCMKGAYANKILLVFCAVILLSVNSIFAQNDVEKEEGYIFKIEKEIRTTPVEDQNASGTCWAHAFTGFLGSELIRMNKGEHVLSEMWIVRHAYEDKAQKYVRMHGSLNFGAGGAFCDGFNVLKNYGIVPKQHYQGLHYGETKHVHWELDNLLKSFVDAVLKNGNKKLTPVWFDAYKAVLDVYLGKEPENFTYNGKTYKNAKEFSKSLNINVDDYINITSFTHHPFYERFIIEVPDNWAYGEAYNLPLDEMMQVIDHAINNGYTILWGTDVSEKGFSRNKCIAVVPDENPQLYKVEADNWEQLSTKEKEDILYKFDKPMPEKVITQELRQQSFDNYTTTDDHGMVICGIAKDQNGTKYYYVKNSWGTTGPYKGFYYFSESFVKYKTMNFILHKDALPKEIKRKLGIN